MPYQCAICGKEHDSLPMDIAFQKPEAYFRIPEAQRARRIKINADLCVIDDQRYFIRGLLPVPVLGTDQRFGWGMWAQVARKDYQRYRQLWNVDASAEPPFRGTLSASVPGYADLETLEVDIFPGKAADRPLFRLLPSDHLLAQEQMHGITMDRVHEILETIFPQLFR
jgi:hypothetical protein